jgi:hypothetical protein
MNPEPDKEKIEAHKRMADMLVQLGLASRVMFNDATRSGDIHWTPDGLIFRNQLLKTYDQLAKGKGKEGMGEFMLLLTWLLKHR